MLAKRKIYIPKCILGICSLCNVHGDIIGILLVLQQCSCPFVNRWKVSPLVMIMN